MLEVFYEAISWKRPSGSLSEMQFVGYLAQRNTPDLIDEAGNLHYDRRAGKSKTLFVSHTDTAHTGWKGGPNKFKVEGNLVRADGDCLGADDAAGIQILVHMLEMGVPGYYIFTRGEEVGGVGASYLVQNMPELLEQFDRAIAFDRKDVTSVITYQGGTRCCSDKFGEALATALNDQGLLYQTDDTGIFTDTAMWTKHIPECTNISCGYWMQHSEYEHQDIAYLQELMKAAVNIDWEALPTVRSTVEVNDDEGFNEYRQLMACLEAAASRKPAALKGFLVDWSMLTPDEVDGYTYASAAENALIAMEQIGTYWDCVESGIKVLMANLKRKRAFSDAH